ncbi:MAG: amino acid permease [Lentisphaeria bacterium]|nr:amino acid permease [Lentisphaeria bacterium]
MDGNNKEKKLGVIPLAALVVSAMIGGGIFSLPQNMAQSSALLGVILAWIVTGIGMFFLANTFRILAEAKPDATTGIYAYARLGFGRFAGFQMAWSYWLCNIFGNVGYAVLLMDAFDYFFPGKFTGGNNFLSILCGSAVIWLMNYIVLKGVHQAAFLNVLGTIAKLVPIILFILIMLFVFQWSTFSLDVLGNEVNPAKGIKDLGSIMTQLKGTMLVTLWAFIGIEGAVVISDKAKDQKSVGKATLLGFLTCLMIYALLSILPFGRMPQHELAGLANPSTAPLLQSVVGHWGGTIMNLGVIIALLTSWLAFTIMIAQIPYAAALDGTFPKFFTGENRNGVPNSSLITTSILMQLAMILVYFANNAWNTMLSVTGVMILPPYLACTLYLWKLCLKKEYPAQASVKLPFACICGTAGTFYAIWMIYAAGLQYLLMAFVFLALGIPLFIAARKENIRKTISSTGRGNEENIPEKQETIFSSMEFSFMLLILFCAIAAIIAFATGKVHL